MSPSDALLEHLPSYLDFSYLGLEVSLHGCSSKTQPLLLTLDVWAMVERSDRMWSTAEGNGKLLQYSCLENPMNSMKRQNDRIPKEELPRSVGAQYATGDQWRNNSRKNEGMELEAKCDVIKSNIA